MLTLSESDCAKFQGSWDPELALGASLGCHKRRGSLAQITLSLKRYAGEAILLETHALSKLRALTVLFKKGGGAGFIDEFSPVLRVLAIPSCDDFGGAQEKPPPLPQKRNHAALCQANPTWIAYCRQAAIQAATAHSETFSVEVFLSQALRSLLLALYGLHLHLPQGSYHQCLPTAFSKVPSTWQDCTSEHCTQLVLG